MTPATYSENEEIDFSATIVERYNVNIVKVL